MSAKSTIEWTDATWNPVRGCSRVSEGCRNCYAERVAARFAGPGQPYEGLVRRPSTANGQTEPRWNGEVRFVPGRLADPLRWKKPRRVFVNSMSDLFHERLSDQEIAAVFAVMAAADHHTFQVLTKRPERMRQWFGWLETSADIGRWHGARAALSYAAQVIGSAHGVKVPAPPAIYGVLWPLPNVWLGVSVEDQTTADERIPLLLDTPAAVRFVSYEPALGPVCLSDLHDGSGGVIMPLVGLHWVPTGQGMKLSGGKGPRLDWIIAGSESGPGARPAELGWFRSVRDRCAAAGVPFFFKQWVGERGLTPNHLGVHHDGTPGRKVSLPILDGRQHVEWPAEHLHHETECSGSAADDEYGGGNE